VGVWQRTNSEHDIFYCPCDRAPEMFPSGVMDDGRSKERANIPIKTQKQSSYLVPDNFYGALITAGLLQPLQSTYVTLEQRAKFVSTCPIVIP